MWKCKLENFRECGFGYTSIEFKHIKSSDSTTWPGHGRRSSLFPRPCQDPDFMRFYFLVAQLEHLHDLHEHDPGVAHELQPSPQLSNVVVDDTSRAVSFDGLRGVGPRAPTCIHRWLGSWGDIRHTCSCHIHKLERWWSRTWYSCCRSCGKAGAG